ncbi:uncharacterized protein LOC131294402 [Anopheles ziemanni]|uniref:uncharacterized protein LOC131265067 n=1 Tax=Anopheles coustani TaxID=139045 RepID=UPI00265922AB|nr:uncharacterized protein LOC131265067 [Anopheles coustani]XP_058178433.1 uncharacterized protein LOC131294402 [Anopheles ziemanni]
MCERKPPIALLAYAPCAVFICLLAVRTTLCVPTHFMETERYRYSVDLDAEQTEARYDQGMLSDIINDNDRGELQKAESCMVDNFKYDHGQKLQRLDPCEICLCIDGEIFCWWKQCDPLLKTSHEYEEDHLAESSPILDHPSLGTAAELSTIINAANATNESANGSTRLSLADTLSDSGTTAFSSTVALSTPSSHGRDGDATILEPSVRHGSAGHLQDALEGIPQNILSFPQSPPIMMYRPISSGPVTASNPTRDDKDQVGGRKKEGKGKGVGHKKAKEHKKSAKAQPSKGYAFDVKRKPTVSIASDALPRKDIGVTESDRSVREKETTEPVHQQPTSEEASVSEPEQFGGYGFGMIHEPESDHSSQQRGRDRDVPQHYIITSSGHVEMFDDSGTIGGPEIGSDHQDVLSFDGRVSSPVLQDHGSASESASEDSSGTDSDETDESKANDDGGPVAPAIMLTTNVTQGKYSVRSSTTIPPAPPSSVIDILNTTTLETDYGEGTNHSELIYPEVPSENTQETAGSSSGSISSSSSTTRSPTESTAENVTQEEPHCVVLGVTYPVGAEVKKVGLCMYCVCEAGPDYDSSPRVSCTRLNCPPLILPDMLDEAGY